MIELIACWQPIHRYFIALFSSPTNHPRDMKSVVHIGTSDKQGGAAIAAWRLHEGLRLSGVDSRVVCRHRTWSGPDVSCISTPLFEAADLFHQRRVVPAQPKAATRFSLSPVLLSILDHPWIAGADVVHLHWVAQFLAPEDIAGLCKAGKRVFWTLHDQWPYTGGCHYIRGNTREEGDWDGTAQIGGIMHRFARMELQRKKQAFADALIHVIAPSRWMAEEAAASGVFQPARIHIVPYGIDTTIFRPSVHGNGPENAADDGKVRLLFGCQYLGERRKGFLELRQALLLCMADPLFVLAVEDNRIGMTTFGGTPEGGLDLPIPANHLGMLPGDEEVADVIRNSSAFVCPTLEDNLPNVVMESIACGCPVIAFSTGGIPDMVSHEGSGLLAPKGDVEALANCIKRFCLDGKLRKRLRDGTNHTCSEKRSLQTQASRILELYEAASAAPGWPGAGKLAECLPSITVDAAIHPNFGTELVRVFLEEKTIQQSEMTLRAEELNVSLVNAWEKVAQSQRLISKSQRQIEQLQRRLQSESSTKNRQQIFCRKLKSKLKQADRRMGGLKVKIANLQEMNLKLRTPRPKKSPFQRVRHFIQRRWRGK